MRKLISALTIVTALILFVGCATTTNENVKVYLRDDVDTSESKVIVFPMLLKKEQGMEAANASFSNPLVDAFIGKAWYDELGENSIVIPKIALDKIPNAYKVIGEFVKVLDVTSIVEQSKAIEKLLSAMEDQFGDGAFAFALAFEDESEYQATGMLHFNMGLFDTKKLTWKWITKDVYVKSTKMPIPIPYAKIVQDMVSASYSSLKAKNQGNVR